MILKEKFSFKVSVGYVSMIANSLKPKLFKNVFSSSE